MNDKMSGFKYEGDITPDGQSIWSRDQNLLSLRRQVGMLFQRPNPFAMSIRDNVVAGVKAHQIARASSSTSWPRSGCRRSACGRRSRIV
jgi:phosphate transport system ATP-binding protein